MALETDGASVLLLADAEGITQTVLVPVDDTAQTGQTVTVDGEQLPLITAQVAGEEQTLVRLRSSVGAVFTDPDDPRCRSSATSRTPRRSSS